LRPDPPTAPPAAPVHPRLRAAPAARSAPLPRPLRVRHLGRQPYVAVWRAMQAFAGARGEQTHDELWLLEHDPVYTLGRAGRPEHLLATGDLPVVHTDRGGQVTWHGPGQLVAYLLLDLRRAGLGVRALVECLEETVIEVLASAGVAGERRPGAPGVYVAGRKIAALGLRIRRHTSYHGVALNVHPDLAAFAAIDPCGYPGLEVTSLARLGVPWSVEDAGARLAAILARRLECVPEPALGAIPRAP
jgi:lipoyl(octanoyl) transferase